MTYCSLWAADCQHILDPAIFYLSMNSSRRKHARWLLFSYWTFGLGVALRMGYQSDLVGSFSVKVRLVADGSDGWSASHCRDRPAIKTTMVMCDAGELCAVAGPRMCSGAHRGDAAAILRNYGHQREARAGGDRRRHIRHVVGHLTDNV